MEINELHPLTNEETFGKFVSTLCCNGCKLFNKECTHENAKKHNEDKAWLQQDMLNTFLQNKTNEHVNDINSYYVCEDFKNKALHL